MHTFYPSSNFYVFFWGKIIRLILTIRTVILTFFIKRWFFLWILLEINTLNFIIYSFILNNSSLNACLKYFIIQTIPRRIFLILFRINELFYMPIVINFILPFIFFIKIGIFPFHLWILSISETLNWGQFIIFNTLQKIIPLWMLSLLIPNCFDFSKIILILSSFVACWTIFNQISLKKILALRGIIHIAWISFIIINQTNGWITYAIIYFYCTILLLCLSNTINNWHNLLHNKKNIIYLLVIINFCRLPPLTIFFRKIKALQRISSISTIDLFLVTRLILSSLIRCFVYLIFTYPSLNKKINFSFDKNINIIIWLRILPLSFLIPILILNILNIKKFLFIFKINKIL